MKNRTGAKLMRKVRRTGYPTLGQLKSELEREKKKVQRWQMIRSVVSILAVVAAVTILLTTFFFPVFRIQGNSMAPTMKEGEIVLAMKNGEFQRGDIVVLKFHDQLLVKRVIAEAGDWIKIDLDGNVFVNEELIEESYLQEKHYGNCTLEFPYQVPDGRYFVMGDNREISQDSRDSIIGCIAKEQIIGTVILRIWPFEKIRFWNAD